eukprot:scaffold318739_cov33-Tisochrysis_lutea.AAC.3
MSRPSDPEQRKRERWRELAAQLEVRPPVRLVGIQHERARRLREEGDWRAAVDPSAQHELDDPVRQVDDGHVIGVQ